MAGILKANNITNLGESGYVAITNGVSLDLSAATSALILPKGTTAQRPSPTSAAVRFNTDTGQVEYWSGTAWGNGTFAFTEWIFTSATVKGRKPPSHGDIATHYTSRGATWSSDSTVFRQGRYAGFQLWTVPASGYYDIEVAGASGTFSSGYNQNFGCKIRGRTYLTKGETLEIIVGQTSRGSATYTAPGTTNLSLANPSYVSLGAGGGGTFVLRGGTTTPVIIAGGAGGSYNVGEPGNRALYCQGQTRQIPIHHYNGTNLSNVALNAGFGGKGWDSGGGGGLYGCGQPWGWGGTGANGNNRADGDGDGYNTSGRGLVGRFLLDSSGGTFGDGGFSNLGVNNGYPRDYSEGGFGGGGGGDTGYNAGGGGGGYTGGWAGGGYLDSSNTTGLNQWGVGGGSYILPTMTNIATSDGNFDGSSSFNGSGIENIGYNTAPPASGTGMATDGDGYCKISFVNP